MPEPLDGRIHAMSKLYWRNDALSPDDWDQVEEAIRIEGLEVTKQEVERTPIDSSSVRRMAGLSDGGTVTITMNRTSTNETLIRTWNSMASVSFKLDPPDPDMDNPEHADDSLYFSLVPTLKGYGTIEAASPADAIFAGRMDGDIEIVDPFDETP